MEIISPHALVEKILEKTIEVYKDNMLKISYIDNKSKDIVIIFSHARWLPNDSREMFGGYVNTDRDVLHIVDLKCSWFNNFDPFFVLEKIKHLTNNKNVYLVGASMGGFNAIIFSNYINSKLCIAFGPQYSIDRQICRPSEMTGPRIDAIEDIKISTLFFSKSSKYIILFGNDEEEKESCALTFKKCKDDDISCKILVLEHSGHEVLPYLVKKYGPASKIIEDLINLNFNDLLKTYNKSRKTLLM